MSNRRAAAGSRGGKNIPLMVTKSQSLTSRLKSSGGSEPAEMEEQSRRDLLRLSSCIFLVRVRFVTEATPEVFINTSSVSALPERVCVLWVCLVNRVSAGCPAS